MVIPSCTLLDPADGATLVLWNTLHGASVCSENSLRILTSGY